MYKAVMFTNLLSPDDVTTTVSTVTQSHATYTNDGNVTIAAAQTGGNQQYPQSKLTLVDFSHPL
jgi:hypothetical protein